MPGRFTSTSIQPGLAVSLGSGLRNDPETRRNPVHLPLVWVFVSSEKPEVPRPKPSSEESIALQTAEGEGVAFVYFRRPVAGEETSGATVDEWAGTEFVIVTLDQEKMDVGRHPRCEVALTWDNSVSRAHAELVEVGANWRVEDVGSENGVLVNGLKVKEQLLRNGDLLRFGDTFVVFRQPDDSDLGETVKVREEGPVVTEPQRKVLIELVRPMDMPGATGQPASNAEIAAALHLSQDTVKQHLRKLFQRFGIDDLPNNAKRVTLAKMARDTGVVSPNDLA
jgi:pSer/pThr/pTyr-binding forkhead associated (FHA) protein